MSSELNINQTEYSVILRQAVAEIRVARIYCKASK